MKTLLRRLSTLAVMLVVVGAAYALKLAGFEHPELDAFAAAGSAAILTVMAGL